MKKSTPKIPVATESEILRGVLAVLEFRQVPHMRLNAGGGYRLGKGGKPQLVKGAPEGWPDVIGWLPGTGRFLGIEVKRPGERPRPEQVAILRRIADDGGVGFWVDDVSDCNNLLTELFAGWRIVTDDTMRGKVRGKS